MVSGFAVTDRQLDDRVSVVSVRGEIDLVTAPQVNDAVLRALRDGRSGLILDLSATSFVDSTGLVHLLSMLRRVERSGGCMALVCSNRTILRVFEVTQVHKTLDVFASLAPAVAHVHDRAPAAA
jgi:anti-sigma B factor antagonist